MTSLLRVGLFALLLSTGCGVLFPSSGSPDPTPRLCAAENCEGCCVGDRCLLGRTSTACGAAGASCSDCGSGTCESARCVAPAELLPYDKGSCLSAPTLAPGDSFEGETHRYASHYSSSCGGENTGDFALAVDVPGNRRVGVTVTPLDVQFQPILSAASDCSSSGSVQGIGSVCAAAAAPGVASTYVFYTHDDSPTYLTVDGVGGTTGRFRAEIHTPGESCSWPLELSAENASVAGSTSYAEDDSVGSCGGAGPDYVTEVEVTIRSHLQATVPGGVSGSRPVLYLRKACANEEIACAVSSRLDVYDLEPGTYYLWTDDDLGGTSGDLEVRLTPVPRGDSCAAPIELQFSNGDQGGVAQARYSGSDLAPGSTLSCGSTGYADAVFTFTTMKTFDLEATQNSFYALALRSDACAGPELACGIKSIRVPALPPGTHYLWSQNLSSSAQLDVSLKEPRAGDTCFAPRALAFTGGTAGGDAFLQGSLLGAHHDASSQCGGDGIDEVFQFTTSEVLDLRAELAGADFRPFLSLRSACEGGELTCSSGASANEAGLAVGSLAPGTWWLWVDSATSAATQYSLSASLTPPVATDTCLSPGVLTLQAPADGGSPTATVSGYTGRLFNNTFASCGGAGSADAVYELTLPAAANVTAVVTGSGGLQPTVSVRASCDSMELHCAAAPSTTAAATLSAPLAAGTWFIWVDGLGATSGNFTLEVTAQ